MLHLCGASMVDPPGAQDPHHGRNEWYDPDGTYCSCKPPKLLVLGVSKKSSYTPMTIGHLGKVGHNQGIQGRKYWRCPNFNSVFSKTQQKWIITEGCGRFMWDDVAKKKAEKGKPENGGKAVTIKGKSKVLPVQENPPPATGKAAFGKKRTKKGGKKAGKKVIKQRSRTADDEDSFVNLLKSACSSGLGDNRKKLTTPTPPRDNLDWMRPAPSEPARAPSDDEADAPSPFVNVSSDDEGYDDASQDSVQIISESLQPVEMEEA